MAEFNYYGRWEIYNYSLYDKSKIPLNGELVYFDSIELWIKNVCHVIGNGTLQIQQLPFIETMIIESSVNISLNNYRITGNKTLINNTHISNIITINIGTIGTPIDYELKPGDMVLLKFNGTNWIELKKTGDFTLKLDSDYIIQNDEPYNNYILTENIIITLPLLATNQNKEPYYIINADSNLKTVITQGADQIHTFTKIYLYEQGDFIKIFPTSSTWCISEQNINYDSGRINTNDWTTRSLGIIAVGYDNLTGIIKIGDIVTGVTTGTTGKVIYFTGVNIYLYQVTNGGIFLNNETINFTDGAAALVNEPVIGSNKNKDTIIWVLGMGNRIQYIDKKFLIYGTDSDIDVREPMYISFYTSPPNAVWYGASYFYVAINQIAFRSANYGLDFIDYGGNRVVVNTQNWYYRHRFRIRY